MERDRMVRPGERYRHFKDKLYQIVGVATHSESGEQMVVYQALYGDYRLYVRPLDMFLEEVDREKYPEVSQKYRFQQETSAEAEPQAHPVLLKFLEAETYEEKSAYLNELEKTAGQPELDSIYVVLDMKPLKGTISDQIEGIRRYLDMQKHFDGGHLR